MAELLITLKLLLGISDTTEDSLLLVLLDKAQKVVTRRLFPMGNPDYTLLDDYDDKIIDIAVYLYNRQGGEGEMSRSENGISVSYESGNIPISFLKDIIPFAEVP